MAIIKKSKIPTILGIAILLIGTIAGVFFLSTRQIFKVGADVSIAPKDIRVSNLTENSAVVSWTTAKETTGFLVWGESQNGVNKVEQEEGTSKFFTHSITVNGLKPKSNYFYKINSDGTSFDNNGIPWQFATGAQLGVNSFSEVVSGSVITPSGQPSKKALVYMTVNGYLASTLTSETGNFVFQLGTIRTQNLQGFAKIDPAKTLLEISIQAGPDGVASAQVLPQSANPIPPIVLGRVYDLRNLEPNQNGLTPSAELNLPGNITKESKFSIATPSGTPTATSVILESLSEGEVITSTKPAFFGRGPKGEAITITVESDPITQSFDIAKDGTWTYSPPTDLAPGAHKVTISWIDSKGITRIITRNFIVQAGEVPAFEATPSQTLAPTAVPTSSPTATPRSTLTPSPRSTASTAGVPVTGSLTPTLLLSIMGVAVIAFSFAVWKISENA